MEYNINITNLRKDLYKINESIINNGLVVNVSSKSGDVLMISKEEYNALLETLYLSSNPEVKQSIIDGMNAKPEDCVKEEDVDW